LWWQQALCWVIFLVFGLISTLQSPFPARSFWGHSITADGLVYWFLLAGFVLTNSLLLQRRPQLFRWQLIGILAGAALLALSMYPQMLNWKIDYTIHSGQLWPGTKHILVTGIHKSQQPIGSYSHRGYAGFTLAMASVLSVIALKNKWLPMYLTLPLTIFYTITLSLSGVRGAIVAMLMGWLWLFFVAPQRRVVARVLVVLSLVSVLGLGWATLDRRIENADVYASTPMGVVLKHVTSDRVYLWWKAKKSITARPWLGWGFSGYSIADATILCGTSMELVALEEYYLYCKSDFGDVVTKVEESTSAHNFFLDKALSLGILGTASYLVLLGCYVANVSKMSPLALGAIIAYFVYLITWYDSGQLSHQAWWVLSFQVFQKDNFNKNSISRNVSPLTATVRTKIRQPQA
jgi:hypothetical protein